MKDVMLSVVVGGTCNSEILQMSEIPRIGESISTEYFRKFIGLDNSKVFKVIDIIHYYVDDMSGIDYTIIKLELLY